MAETPEELERAAHIASTTKGTREVVSYVRMAGETVTPGSFASQSPGGYPTSGPMPLSAPQPSYRELPGNITSEPLGTPALPSTEPFYRDPNTGEKVILPPGTKTIPYKPEAPGTPALPYYINPDNGEKVMVVYTTP